MAIYVYVIKPKKMKTEIIKFNTINDIPDSYLLSFCRSNIVEKLSFFIPFAFRILNPSIPFIDNWHIHFISDIIQSEIIRITKRIPKKYDIIINVPPRSLKSIMANVAAPAWGWTVNPYLKWICSSHTKSLSTKHNLDCRRLIESNSYRAMFPEIILSSDENQKTRFSNTMGGYKIATSVDSDSGATGDGADIILIDDPLNPRKAKSANERQNAIDHCTHVLPSRLNDPTIGVIIYIMQRLHEDDPVGYLLKTNPVKYYHVCIPAHYDEEKVKPSKLVKYYLDGLFFPSRFPEFVLRDLEATMTANEYAGQYEQNPSAKEGNIIKKRWFKFIDRVDFDKLLSEQSKLIEKTFTVDTAFTEKKENDASGILGGVLIDDNIYIYTGKKVRLGFPDLLKWLPTYVRNNLYDEFSTVRVEPKANGISLVQQLALITDLNITYTSIPLDSKEIRLNAISRIIEAGRVWVVNSDWTDEFISDIVGFPNRSDKEYVDCLWYIVEYFMLSRFKKRFLFDRMIASTIKMEDYTFYNVISACPLWSKFEYVVIGAYYARNSNDYDVFSVFGTDDKNNMYLINLHREKWENNSNTIRKIIGIYQNFRPNAFCVENDCYEKVYRQITDQGIDFKIKKEKDSNFKHNFNEFLDLMSVWFNEGKLKLPYHPSTHHVIQKIFMEFRSLDSEETKIKELESNKGIARSFWLAFKALGFVSGGLQF